MAFCSKLSYSFSVGSKQHLTMNIRACFGLSVPNRFIWREARGRCACAATLGPFTAAHLIEVAGLPCL